MKILQVITSLQIGGAEKLIVDMVPLYLEQGYQVDVLLFDGTETPFKKQLRDKGITIYQLGRGGSVYNPLYIFKMIPFLRKYDIVHTHNTAPQLFTAIAGLFGTALLVTTEHNTTNRRRSWKWFYPIDKWMYSRYKKVICISEKATENLQTYLKKQDISITTIYNGIDIKRFHNAIPNHLFQEIAPNCIVIVMVAAFREQKDQDTLIRATALLPQQFHTFLIGDGPRKNICENLANEINISKRVHFLGNRMDIPELLQSANYVVMSSHWEGLSLSSIEGMCVEKPFLASDVDGLREIVKNSGILFEHQNASQLAENILKLDASPQLYKKIAEQCWNKAIQFDISNTVNNYIQIYKLLYASKKHKHRQN